MKMCPKCERELPSVEFNKDSKTPDGLHYCCKECQAEYASQYYKANADKIKERSRKYYKANIEKITIYNRKYQKLHLKEFAASNKKHRKAHPETLIAYNRRRRARKYNAFSEKFLDIEIFERDGWVCQICGRKINRRLKWPHPRSKSLDHIVPLVRGGRHARVNVQAAHLRCNMSKNAGNGGQLRLIG